MPALRQLLAFSSRAAASAVVVSGGLLLAQASVFAGGAADTAAISSTAVDALPPNLGKSLRQLIVWHRSQARTVPAAQRRTALYKSLPARAQVNADATQAVVDVTLDGTVALDEVSRSLAALGATVMASHDAGGAGRAGSTISISLPLDQAESALGAKGVFSMMLVPKPWRRIGRTTSQGARALLTDQANHNGFDGRGITVGVVSDSFDRGQQSGQFAVMTRAADDVRNGDLPGPGNPFGHTTAVKVISDSDTSDDLDDEGRAMLQIVHDLAPGAGLMFCCAGETPERMAAAITSLRTQTDPPCDIIVDDVGFPNEPMFSDGIIAQAASDAVHDLLIAGRPVVYVSAAGNEGDSAYEAAFTPVSDADARAGKGRGNLKLDQVSAQYTAGGFHDFNPKGKKVTLGEKVTVYANAEISFQWDDPFLPNKVTTDYNFLVFDQDGTYRSDLSGTDDNRATGKAVELVNLPLKDGDDLTTYQVVIARTAAGTGEAKRLRFVVHGSDVNLKFGAYNAASIFGHNAAPDVIGVAAYAWDHLNLPEKFTSLGPVTNVFDRDGSRLATPEVRQTPTVAGVDGVDTSFFPPGPRKYPDGSPATDTDSDGYPNFFGTSAAAPHVAAVAALLLQAAGGPGSLTAAQVSTLLQTTARSHDLSPNFASAKITPGNQSTVTLSATADESTRASGDNNGFHLAFDGAAGQSLRRVVINLASTGLKFDPGTELGFPFTIGALNGVSPDAAQASLDAANATLTLKFAPGAFPAGSSLNFGIDRDLASSSADGNSADLLAGATVKVKTKGGGGGGNAKGSLQNDTGYGWSPAVGFGLVNAESALASLKADPPVRDDARLVPGDLLLATSEDRLIEARRDGTVVQSIEVPNPLGDKQRNGYEHIQEAVVDANGNIDVLNGIYTPYLTTIDAKTGGITHVTAPKWNLGHNLTSSTNLAGEIVTMGRYVFASYGQQDTASPLGLMLRFNIDDHTVRAFGANDAMSVKTYTALAVGPDGLVYALPIYYTPPKTGSSRRLDVYDPETLALVRTVELQVSTAADSSFSVVKFAIGAGGELYTLSSYNSKHRVDKLAPTGVWTDSLFVTISKAAAGNFGATWTNIRVDRAGNILVGSTYPVLIDPSFQTYKELDVYGDFRVPYLAQATATFIGP